MNKEIVTLMLESGDRVTEKKSIQQLTIKLSFMHLQIALMRYTYTVVQLHV